MYLTKELLLLTDAMINILKHNDIEECLENPIINATLKYQINCDPEFFQALCTGYLRVTIPKQKLEMVVRAPLMDFIYHCPSIYLKEQLIRLNIPRQLNAFYMNTYGTISYLFDAEKLRILQDYLKTELPNSYVEKPVLQHKQVVFDKAY